MPAYKYGSEKYVEWRNKVFGRDQHKCQFCGVGGTINAHHIKRKVDFPRLCYNLNNGITLCKKCHEIITGEEKLFEPLFTKIVNKKISLEFIYAFFNDLVEEKPSIVEQLKRHQKWLYVPFNLVKKVKCSHNDTRYVNKEKNTRKKK